MLKEKLTTRTIARQGVIAAIYVVMTLSLGEFAYGPAQFRYSEILNLLAFYNPMNIFGVTMGVFVSNFWSPYPIDLLFGTFHTFIALYFMTKTKNIWIASLWPTIFAFIIGFEITFFSDADAAFWLNTVRVMISEFIIVTLISVPVYKLLEQNSYFMRLIKGYDY